MKVRSISNSGSWHRGPAIVCAVFLGWSLAIGAETGSDQNTSPTAATNPNDLGELVVTAQRRVQNIEDVPIAVTAITPTAIENLDIRSVQNIQELTPDLVFDPSDGWPATYIRGVGTPLATPGLEAPVATYVDGAYLPRASGTLFQLLDPASVEVLRGPQGTLYGRNASGGAILLNTADPTHELGGYASQEYGNFNHRQSELVLNLPATDTLAFRFAARYYDQDGYLNNIPTTGALGSSEGYDVRGKVKWDPTGDFSAILGVEYSYDDSQRDPAQSGVATGPLCFVCSAYGMTLPASGWNVSNDFPAPFVTYSRDVNLKLNYKEGDLAFQSITSFRNLFGTTTSDQDFSQLPIYVYDSGFGGKTFTQDLQVSSSFSGPVNFLAGLQYIHDNAQALASVYGSLFGIPYTVGQPINRENLPSAFQTVITKSYAGFAEVYIKPIDRLTVTLGGRYSYDARDLSSTETPLGILIFTGGLGQAEYDESASFSKFTPRAVVSYDFDTVNLYASYTQGFKAGGFNTPAFTRQPQINPETIDSYEIGAKYVSPDRRVRLNVAAFHYIYDDLQVSVVDLATGGLSIVNAAKAKGDGVEAEWNYHPTDWLQVGAGGDYLDARYVSYDNAEVYTATPGVPGSYGIPGGVVTTTADLGGTPLPRSPKYTAFLSETIEAPIGANFIGKLNAVARYTSEYNFDPDAGGSLQFDRQPTYTLTNVSGSVGPRAGAYEVGFYIDNLTNKLYYYGRATEAQGPVNYPAPGRTYGLRVKVKF
jgi:iron complex outermembrane recepter protein